MDIDVMRSILMKIDAIETGIIDKTIDLSNYSNKEIESYTVALVKEGFLEFSKNNPDPLLNKRLTYDGRKFIRIARNQVLWKNAKTSINISKKSHPTRTLNTNLNEIKYHFISLSN